MSILTALWAWLKRRAEDVVVLLLGSMFVTFLIQIVFRYLLNLPLGWTIEYVAMSWLWGILFGYAFVLRDDEVIRFDVVYLAMPRLVRRGMDVFASLVCAGILAWSLPKAVGYVQFMQAERTDFMRIPFDLVFSIYPPFVVAVIIRELRNAWRALQGIDRTLTTSDPEAHEIS